MLPAPITQKRTSVSGRAGEPSAASLDQVARRVDAAPRAASPGAARGCPGVVAVDGAADPAQSIRSGDEEEA